MAALGERFGEYEIEAGLGQGGMASVFLARERFTHRQVALKVLEGADPAKKELVDRFILEARASIGMRHENIVEVFTCGENSGRYYMACEFADGGTVRQLRLAIPRFPKTLAIELMAQLLSGLAYAHARGVVHRDVKPANLLLTKRGQLKICDFGISRSNEAPGLTKTDMLLGTPDYMSPEQAMGERVDPRSDLFSAGVVFYELLSGQNPFTGENATASIMRILAGNPPEIADTEPTVDEWIERVISRLLSKEPSARFATAEEVLAELDPHVKAARARYPTLVADFLADPEGMWTKLRADEAAAEVATAQRLLKMGLPEQNQAALCLHRAVLLDPSSAEAARLFTAVSGQVKMRFERSTNPRIVELERALGKEAKPARILQELAKLYRAEGNLERAVLAYQRYLRLVPTDSNTRTQLTLLIGKTEVVAAPTRIQPRAAEGPSTQELVAGIKTGGFAAPPVADPTLRLTAPKPLAQAPVAVRQFKMDNLPAEGLSGTTKLILAGIALGGCIWAYRALVDLTQATQEHMNEAFEVASAAQAAEESVALKAQIDQDVKAAIHANAQDAAARLERGNGELASGAYREAIVTYDSVLERYHKRPEAKVALLKKAEALLALGQASDATRALDEFVSTNVGHASWPDALLLRAKAYAARARHDLAIKDLSTLLSKHPTSGLAVEATLLRGEAYVAQGGKADATADFNAVIGRTGPSDPFHQRAQQGLGAGR